MKTGLEAASRARGEVSRLVSERHEVVEELWEHPVESRRLGVRGRVDYIAVTAAETLVLVEVKLQSLSRRSLLRSPWLRAQLAAYTVAAEETLGMPLEASYIYSVEAQRLIEYRVTQVDRRLAAHAAEELWRMLREGPPQHPRVPPWRCRGCGYRRLCPAARS